MSETVTITALSGDEEFTAYVARPAGSPKAAIVVIQEIFAVSAIVSPKTAISPLLPTSSGGSNRRSSSIPMSNRNSSARSI